MNKKQQQKLGTFMCLLLRHNPPEFNLQFDEFGFVDMDEFLAKIQTQEKWKQVTLKNIYDIVESDEKQRYTVETLKIRANYGHSFQKIDYVESEPPAILYHGTHTGVVEQILGEGIKSMGRQYVHLSETTHFATLSGQRRGELVLLEVNTQQARKEGVKFYYAGNEVWLAKFIPSTSIVRKQDE